MLSFVKQWLKNKPLESENTHLVIGAIVVVLIYGVKLLSNANGLHFGDADFFFAMGEAFRINVLEFHQFPWLNPWIAGGIPLYADPQFGLFSIQSVLILLFGSVAGWKLAIITYILIGYFGFYHLLAKVFKAPPTTAILIALTWAFAGIWMVRSMGHFTFFGLAFLPWALYYLWNRKATSYSHIKLGVICALAINSSPHNTTVILLSILGSALIFELVRLNRSQIGGYAKFVGIFLLTVIPLSVHKLFFTYAYAKGNSIERIGDPEEYPGLKNIIEALFGFGNHPGVLPSKWGKGEALVGIGFGPLIIVMLVIVVFLLLRVVKLKNNNKFNFTDMLVKIIKSPLLFIVLMTIMSLLLALGDFVKLSPYSLLRELPVFENTRVAVRWFIPAAFGLLVIIGTLKYSRTQRLYIHALLATNLVILMLFVIQAPNLYTLPNKAVKYDFNTQSPPEQLSRWSTPRDTENVDDNLYPAIQNNIGQISTNLVPFFDTKFGGTKRCSEIIKPCQFIISKNAELEFWSPNKIILKRNAAGPIELNMNPTKYWLLNNKQYLFTGDRFTDPHGSFIFDNESSTIELEYSPPLTIDWLRSKL